MKYGEPKNLIEVTKTLTKTIEITQDASTNLTLFNPHMTARPIQLKNVLKTVYQEYRGRDAPDRFNQQLNKYHATNGVLYRNLQQNQSTVEGLSRAQGKSKTGSHESPGGKVVARSSEQLKKQEYDRGRYAREGSKLSKLDLTDPALLFTSDKHLTKFELQDSQLSRELEHLAQKEFAGPLPNRALLPGNGLTQKESAATMTSAQSGASSKTVIGAAGPEEDHHQQWLEKRGIGADGRLPPVTIKTSGKVFYSDSTQAPLPRTAEGGTRMDYSKGVMAAHDD